jgi:hypothetical protein
MPLKSRAAFLFRDRFSAAPANSIGRTAGVFAVSWALLFQGAAVTLKTRGRAMALLQQCQPRRHLPESKKRVFMSVSAIESVLQQMRATALQSGIAPRPAAAEPAAQGGFAAELRRSLEGINTAPTKASGAPAWR